MSLLVTGDLGVLGRQPLTRLAAARRGTDCYDRAAPSGETVGGVAYVTRDLTPESVPPEYVAWLRTHERSVTQG